MDERFADHHVAGVPPCFAEGPGCFATGVLNGSGMRRNTMLTGHDAFISDISLLRRAFHDIAVQQMAFFRIAPEALQKKPIWRGVLTGDGVSGLVPAF